MSAVVKDVDAFVIAATDGRAARARAYLETRPEILDDPWARLVAGRGWEGDPNAPGGPRDWPPLVYASHSVLGDVETVRALLARGADPDATGLNEYGPMSAVYGASGVARDPERTRVLLEAGADPNDNESLYHASESGDTTCLRLLLAHGGRPNGTNALAHALDYEPLEPVRLLLEAGADPNEHAHVAHAVRRGRGPEAIRLLAEHGADLLRPGGETWRGDVPLRSPYAHAVLRSRDDVVEALRDLGAETPVSAGDRAVAVVARGEAPPTPLPGGFDVDQQEVLILAALDGRVDAVVDAVGVGFAGVVAGSPAGTLLHHAGWVGSADVTRRLLDRGADALARSGGLPTALGWGALGSQFHELEGRDYVAVARMLVEAGDTMTDEYASLCEGPLREWAGRTSAG